MNKCLPLPLGGEGRGEGVGEAAQSQLHENDRDLSPEFGAAARPPHPSLSPKGERGFFKIALVLLFAALRTFPLHAEELRPYSVVGNAIPDSLTGRPGDAARGRAIVTNRQVGLCLLCHSGPFPEEKFQGNLAPDLAGAGARWSEGELRLRLVDASRLNPDSIMPSYYRIEGLSRVAPAFAGKPLLTAEQIEDVVAYLASLKQ